MRQPSISIRPKCLVHRSRGNLPDRKQKTKLDTVNIQMFMPFDYLGLGLVDDSPWIAL